ncbi:MAG: sodium:proton antiporter [Lachnospiraceae bacterium]|nr:sodium:proton antiporter [Lachnospiraceae bacterium]
MSGVMSAQNVLLTGIMFLYAGLVVLVLIRAVSGPRIADRLMAINMIGTIGIFLMAVTAVKLDEEYLLDICVIYAMISFLSVVILTKVYMGVHLENEMKRQKQERLRRESEEANGNRDKEEDELDRLLKGLEELSDGAAGN